MKKRWGWTGARVYPQACPNGTPNGAVCSIWGFNNLWTLPRHQGVSSTNGMLSPIYSVHAKLVEQCGVYVCHYWSVPIPWTSAVFYWWSNSQNAVQLKQHSGCWDLHRNSIRLLLPICLLGTITRGVQRLYTQLGAILDSVPEVTA